MEIKTAIVTGASGFVGRALVKSLSESGITVFAIARSHDEELSRHENVSLVLGDLEKIKELTSKIPLDCDVLFHLAWKGISAQEYKDIGIQKDNIPYMVNVMDMAIRLKCKKIVLAGSNQEYLMAPNSVDGKSEVASVYGACKLACTSIGRTMARNRIHFNIASFTNVFGVDDWSNRTANFFISKMSKDEDIDLIEGENLYDWIYIDDAVSGLIHVAEKGINSKEYYVGRRNLYSFKDILLRVKESLDSESKLNFGKYSDDSFTDYTKFDLDALYNDTGFECQADFKESILKTAQWLKNRKKA